LVRDQCAKCRSRLRYPAVCEQCGALYVEACTLDHFAFLSLPVGQALPEDELEEHFLELSRLIHPDFYASSDGQELASSLQLAAKLNEAHETLKDPISRAEYLLRLFGGSSEKEDDSVPDGLLSLVFDLREKIETARQEENGEAIEKLRQWVGSLREDSYGGICELAGSLGPDCRGELKRELRRELNAWRYIDNLWKQVS